MFENCLKIEHKYSILHDYKINSFIVPDFKEKLLNHVDHFTELY